MAVSERLQEELLAALRTPNYSSINFELLYQLVRAMCNILILTMDQLALVRSLHRQDDNERNMSQTLIDVLNRMPNDLLLLSSKSDQSKVLPINQVRNFVLFLTHSLRLLITMQAVDKNCLESTEDPQRKTSLQHMLRKYGNFETAFPLSKRLMDSLKGDMLWFSHATQADYCKLTPFYESEESKYQTCAKCGKVDMGLKVCSRCRKAYYCDQVCQKAHYPKHKQHCMVKSLDMLTAAVSAIGESEEDAKHF